MAYIGFKKLEGKLAGKAEDPGAVAAAIGRKKYGKAKFQKAAATGTSMRGMKPMGSPMMRVKALRGHGGGHGGM